MQLYSQDFSKIYYDYTPKKLIKNEGFKTLFNNKIKEVGSVNPDLIYFYLKYLKNRFDNNINKPSQNGFLELTELLKKYRFKKAEWAENEYNSALRKSDSEDITRVKNTSKYFSRFVKEGNSNFKNIELSAIDSSLMNYYSYIFIIQEKVEYDSTVNYKKKLNEATRKRSKEFEKIYRNKVKNKNIVDSTINKALMYCYLFDDSYLDDYVSTDIQLNDFIFSVLEVNYNTSDEVNYNTSDGFYFSVSNAFFLNNFEKESSFFRQFFPEYDKKVPITTFYRFSALIGYRYSIASFLKPFCYINTELSISFLNISDTNFENDEEIVSGIRAIPDIGMFQGKLSSPILNDKSYVLSLNLSSPVMFINPNWNFNTGIRIKYYNFSYSISFDESKYYFHTSKKDFDKVILKLEDSRFVFSPNFTGIHKLSNSIMLNYGISFNLNQYTNSDLPLEIELGLVYDFGK